MAEMIEIKSCERKTPLTDFERTVQEWNPLSKGVFHIFTANMSEDIIKKLVDTFTGRYVPNGQRVEICVGSRVGEKRLQFIWEVTGENFFSHTALLFFPSLERLVDKYEKYISHYPQ